MVRPQDDYLTHACRQWCDLLDFAAEEFERRADGTARGATFAEFLRGLCGDLAERGLAHRPGDPAGASGVCFCGGCGGHWTGYLDLARVRAGELRPFDLIALFARPGMALPICETCGQATLWVDGAGRHAMFALLGRPADPVAEPDPGTWAVELGSCGAGGAREPGASSGAVATPYLVALASIVQDCAGCGAKVHAKRQELGRQVRCARCGATVAITAAPTMEWRIRFWCPTCRAAITGSIRYVGRAVPCPGCGTVIEVREPQTAAGGPSDTEEAQMSTFDDEQAPAEADVPVESGEAEGAELFAFDPAEEASAADGAMDAPVAGAGPAAIPDDRRLRTAQRLRTLRRRLADVGRAAETLRQELRRLMAGRGSDTARVRELIDEMDRQHREHAAQIDELLARVVQAEQVFQRELARHVLSRAQAEQVEGLRRELAEARGAAGQAASAADAVPRPDPARELLSTARRLHDDKQYARCIETIGTLLEVDPGSADAMMLLGSCHAQMQELPRAARMLRRCLNSPRASDQQRLFCLVELGKLHGRAGQFRSARRTLEAALAIAPADAAVHRNLGNVLARLGELSEAVNHWRQSLAGDPNQPRVRQMIEDAVDKIERGNIRPGEQP